jgi:hypothetical protein
VDETLVDMIKAELPAPPWKIGIHWEISKKLGVHPDTVYSAISVLIKRGISPRPSRS